MRTAAFLLVAPLIIAILSGCLGGGKGTAADPTEAPSGTLDSTQEAAPPAQADNKTGAIAGRVTNENAAPIARAFVILVGSRNSTYTDKLGEFTISYVEPGEYVLRVDADTYRPLESSITVSPGSVTRVNVTVVPMVDRGSGFREHLHDFWGDDTQKVLLEEQLNFDTSLASGGTQGSQFCGAGVSSGTCPERIDIILPAGTIVYPGTRMLTITASWKTESAPTAVFRYIPANDTKLRQAPIQSGTPLDVPVEYPMTDHGHQTYTMWTMEIVPDIKMGPATANQGDYNRRNVGPVQVKVVAHKGIVPAEPAHPAFWTNSSKITLADRLEKTYTALPTPANRNPKAVTCAGQESGATTCMVLPQGALVPPGTTRLEVVFETVYAQPAAASTFSTKVLTFRTASVNPREATFADLRVEAPAKSEGTKLTYELRLDAKEVDAFYQKKSLWMFSVANEGREREPNIINECSTTGCGGTKFYLTVVAINDDFQPAAAT